MPLITTTGYRQSRSQTVTLPSGGQVRIGKVQHAAYFSLGGELPRPLIPTPDNPAPAPPDAQEMARIRKFMDRTIAEGAISPRFTDELDADGFPVYHENILHVRELDQEDYDALRDAILALTKMDVQGGQELHSFRADEIRPDDPRPGPGVSRPAAHAAVPDAVGVLLRPVGDVAAGDVPEPGPDAPDDEAARP